MVKMKTKSICQLPKVSTVSGRSSSITNAFINAILPVHKPTYEEELKALAILEMSSETICCAYCGGKYTEWDHLRPIIRGKEPTGFITEIANLVPACGKCNQSKGGSDWKSWMLGPALQSPKSRNIPDIEKRIALLEHYVLHWGDPVPISFQMIVGVQKWNEHKENLKDVLGLLEKSQELAKEIRKSIGLATQRILD
jgi:5-methylcytosine-specific restriction endonuclease McrA